MSVFTILSQPVTILVTAFSKLIKSENDRYILYWTQKCKCLKIVVSYVTSVGTKIDFFGWQPLPILLSNFGLTPKGICKLCSTPSNGL